MIRCLEPSTPLRSTRTGTSSLSPEICATCLEQTLLKLFCFCKMSQCLFHCLKTIKVSQKNRNYIGSSTKACVFWHEAFSLSHTLWPRDTCSAADLCDPASRSQDVKPPPPHKRTNQTILPFPLLTCQWERSVITIRACWRGDIWIYYPDPPQRLMGQSGVN